MSNVTEATRKSGACRNCGKNIWLSCKRGKPRWRHRDTKNIHCGPVPPKAAPV